MTKIIALLPLIEGQDPVSVTFEGDDAAHQLVRLTQLLQTTSPAMSMPAVVPSSSAPPPPPPPPPPRTRTAPTTSPASSELTLEAVQALIANDDYKALLQRFYEYGPAQIKEHGAVLNLDPKAGGGFSVALKGAAKKLGVTKDDILGVHHLEGRDVIYICNLPGAMREMNPPPEYVEQGLFYPESPSASEQEESRQ